MHLSLSVWLLGCAASHSVLPLWRRYLDWFGPSCSRVMCCINCLKGGFGPKSYRGYAAGRWTRRVTAYLGRLPRTVASESIYDASRQTLLIPEGTFQSEWYETNLFCRSKSVRSDGREKLCHGSHAL
ncbi:hypothetical protein BD324DRAFT_615533 [Kockovaella imperatae]|uniref:Secreted protein n=1 Tax=Kockovaella imperatae TaxID=4999 RepID=A0A1Y1UPD9_9TREE|nr:hypothetical protein BD324DRAFT_615533 [Kockovaella imperatae]ORX39920.1 hypothetical protein BD324DRAFT_615533 [Kockovaella imperatae]